MTIQNKESRVKVIWLNLVSLALLPLMLSICIAGQTSNSNEFKTDKNLRSSARINPATLAMEFSLPLAEYPGRAGSSVPITFSYSSKVWTIKRWQFWHNEQQGGVGTESNPFLTTNITEYMPIFGKDSLGGWTSGLRALQIVPDDEGYVDDGGGRNNLVGNDTGTYECTLVSSVSSYDPTCYGGIRVHDTWSCILLQLDSEEHSTDYCFFGPAESGGGTDGGGVIWLPGSGDGPVHPPNVTYPDFRVNQFRVIFPDGTSSTFRKDDKVYDCNYPDQCAAVNSRLGSFLSVDGTGRRLVMAQDANNQSTATLFNLDGSRWVITAPGNQQEYYDKNGNKLTYDINSFTWTDTKGNQILNPLSTPESRSFDLPGMAGRDPQNFSQTWNNLKPAGCTTGTESECGNSALENPSDALYSQGTDVCGSRYQDQPTSLSPLFPVDAPRTINQPNEQNHWYSTTTKERTCGAQQFNPILLTEVTYPDGSKYKFRYNRYGELSKIIYPTGSYERFSYDSVQPLTFLDYPIDKANRGVVERWISEDGQNISQHWTYAAGGGATVITNTDPNNHQISRTETKYLLGSAPFGLENPLNGQVAETKSFDENNVLKSRILNYYDVTLARPGGDERATRNARLAKSVSIIFEGPNALATLTQTDYDVDGSNDPEFFSDLNVKRKKDYGFVPVPVSTATANNLSWQTIDNWFAGAIPAGITETDYAYDDNYKAHGILGLPIETRAMDPTHPNDPNFALAKSRTIYDNAMPAPNSNYPYAIQTYGTENSWDCSSNPSAPTICWKNPNGSNSNINLAYRGLPTTTLTSYIEGNTSIETHTQYDQFGNVVKVRDPIGNEVTTVYDAQYKYAYPTTVIAPAPDPTNTHGTSSTSTTSTTYDFTTGLPLSVTDDFGQVTTTEYDISLRPFKFNPVVVNGSASGPKTETEYGQPNSDGQLTSDRRYITSRKQLDANNWDESTTWFDGLGRTIRTRAKDSQGDVYVDTRYDDFGRVKHVSNPYRAGDTLYWSTTRYDTVGRAVETFAPATTADIDYSDQHDTYLYLTSLGTTSFAICGSSDQCPANFVGTVVITTDASGRKSRSITNALGQLVRVDEPTATGGSETNDLGSLASPNQATVYKYDLRGKMVQVNQGIQNRYFKYDSLGRLLRLNQPEQEINSGIDLSDSFNTSGHWTAAFAYDISGNVIRATDANGVNIINEYDKANRVTKRCYTKPNVLTSATSCAQISSADLSSDTPTVEFWYDGQGLDSIQTPHNFAKGKLTKVDNSISRTRYTLFDNFGRLLSSEQKTPLEGQTMPDATGYVSHYAYNLSGALLQETYPSGRVIKNEFEPDGDLAEVVSKKADESVFIPYVSNFSYTASGGISQMRLGNGKWETATFDERLQVKDLGLGSSGTDAGLWKVHYDYGELNDEGSNVVTSRNTGNIARQILTVPGASLTQTYRYDALYRLADATEPNGTSTPNWSQHFDYDRYGNRIGFIQNLSGVTTNVTPSVDPNKNRFNDGQGFVYDNNGNIVQDVDPATSSNRTFIFNADNKQSEVKDANGASVGSYFYDGEGNRVKKIAGDETTVFVYSSGKLVAEYSTRTAPNQAINYTTTDHLGSPRIITDQFGQVTSRRDFMPFGEQISATVGSRGNLDLKYSVDGDTLRQNFTGYQKDEETSLDFAVTRMYENRFGRFTAVDPLLASGTSYIPQSFNRYVYTRNAPLVQIDPSGAIPGHYYDRQGNYLGDDDKKDDAVYFADVTRRDDGNKIIYVNTKTLTPTTLDEVERVRGDRSSQIIQREAESTLGISPLDLETIPDRARFYGGFSRHFSNGARWPGAATQVAADMDWLTRPIPNTLGYSNEELARFANTGNRMIFDDVYSKLAALRTGGLLNPEQAYAWDAMTLAQEQSLIDPLYSRLTPNSLGLLETGAKRSGWLLGLADSAGVFGSRAFPADRNIADVNQRWEFGMKAMGYNVSPNQMPDPGIKYRSGEMYNRLNPANPVGPSVMRVSF